MKLDSANRPRRAIGLEKLPGISNYFIGNDPAQWHTNVPQYARIQFEGVYPGIDQVWYGNQRRLEYDFVVAPGADAKQIQVAYEGVESLRVEANGDLVLRTALGEMRQQKPRVYQEIGGRQVEVAAQYAIVARNRVSFELAGYDRKRGLRIDPVVLAYSTYLGGSDTDAGGGIAVDGTGSAYITGCTTSTSTNFPTQSPYQATYQGGYDVFVTKLTPAGNALAYSTYLGGSGNDQGSGIAVDAAGYAYVTGSSTSYNFPTQLPYQATLKGSTNVFVTKLTPAGTLAYSTYLGGSGNDQGNGIAVDGAGSAYVAGQTKSTNFPTRSAYQAMLKGTANAFVTKLTPSGNALAYSTYLGGTSSDSANGIAVDAAGSAYVTGTTASPNFPTQLPYQATLKGSTNVFVTKLSSASRVGIFRGGFFWLLDVDGNQQFDSPPDRAFAFGGIPGDIPITGDWNGSGTTKVGVYRSSNGLFLLDYDGDGQFTAADKVYSLGVGTQSGDVPVVGDWNGDGRSKVGIFRQGFFWILDTNGNGTFDAGDQSFAFGGVAGDVPVVGDWNGSGTSKVGVFRAGYLWVLDTNGNHAVDSGDQVFPFGGIAGDVPVVGDWNGDGRTKVGVFRNGFYWVLDTNGDQVFDQSTDQAFAFGGIAGDKPVVGKW